MKRNFLFVPVVVMLALGAAAVGLASAAPERTINQPFSQKVASGAATLMMRGIAAGYSARPADAADHGSPVLVQVTFKALGDLDTFRQRMDGFAPFLSNVPGLVWKVWALDDETRDASGTYLFESRSDAEMYLSEILPEGMGDVPYISAMSFTITPVMRGPSLITHAELSAGGGN